jgi:hypothetical protein
MIPQLDTAWTGKEELDLGYLTKLRSAIDLLLHLESNEDDEDSIKLHDARTDVKRRIKGAAIDLNIHSEFLDSYIKTVK